MDDEGLADAAQTARRTGKLPVVCVRRNYAGDMTGSGCPLCGSVMKHRDFLADVTNSRGVVSLHFECFKSWQSALLASLTIL
jgi:hypothetical protein